jgi:N-formylglutamate deformylase
MDFSFTQGRSPILVSMPHVGTDIPDDVAARMTPEALVRQDTDWHLVQLYDFLQDIGASVISARWSRYAIDLNRPPENTNLYPGMDTTGLCPLDTFHREPIYQDGFVPSEADVRDRLERYWRPYHTQLRTELDRIKAQYGKAVLWDAHSIASVVPRFFEGKLPDLNFGTAEGASCDRELQDMVVETARSHGKYSIAVNGRFKGGHITRHYGQPKAGVHAIQLEMCQSVYMNEDAPFDYRPDLAAGVKDLLENMLLGAAGWAADE